MSDAPRPRACALALLLTGCAGAAGPFVAPEDGGRPWHEITSPHYRIRTDLPASRARSIVAEMESIHSTFEDIAFPYEVKPTGRVQIVVFADRDDLTSIAGKGVAGFYRRSLDPWAPSLFFSGDFSDESRHVFQHELTHRFVHFYLPGAPRWLNEGLAKYYSTMVIEDGKVVLGRDLPNLAFRPGNTWIFERTPVWIKAFVPTELTPSVDQLLATTAADFITVETDAILEEREQKRVLVNYATAWALVHTLRNGPSRLAARFDDLLAGLAAGKSAAAAWSDAYRSIGTETIDAALDDFMARRETTLLRAPYEPRVAELESTRELTALEVHLLWAAIRPSDVTALEVGAAAAIDPRAPEVLLWKSRLARRAGQREDALRHLRAAVAAAPGDERYEVELFATLADGGAKRSTADLADLDRMAADLAPRLTTPHGLNEVAWHLAERGRHDDAYPLAIKAVNADFSCFECIDTLAFILHGKGDLAGAFEAQTLALGVMPDSWPDDRFVARWRRYRDELARVAK